MELRRIRVKTFRRFKDLEAEFSQGLNVIEGPNEAGKSTLHDAILLSLFDRPSGKGREGEYQAWGEEGRYQLLLTYRLASGNEVSLFKDYESITHKVIIGEEEDSSKSALDRALQSALGTTSLKLFESTACIRQDSMADLEVGKDEISKRLQRIVLGQTADLDEVLAALEGRISEIERGWKTHAPKNPGPVRQIKRRLAEIEAQISKIRPEIEAREAARENLVLEQDRLVRIEEELRPMREVHEVQSRRQKLREDLEERIHLERNLEKQVSKILAAERELKAAQAKLDDKRAFVGFDDVRGAAIRRAYDRVRERSIEERDRGARFGELAARLIQLKQHATHFSTIPLWLLISGFIIAASGALARFLPMDREAFEIGQWLMMGGGVMGILTGGWLLLEFLVVHRKIVQSRNQLREAQDRFGEGEQKRREAEAHLLALLGEMGCTSWEEYQESVREIRTLQSEVEAATARLHGLLGEGEGRELLEEKRRMASRERRDLQEQLDDLGVYPELPALEYQRMIRLLERREAEASESKERLIRLETRGELGRHTTEDLHRLEEWRASLERQLEIELDRRQIYCYTAEGLKQVRERLLFAVQNQLEGPLSAYLNRLSKGRYRKAIVTADLGIELLHESKNDGPIKMEELSQGTRDQVYLAARLALCDMIFGDSQPPLLMDDPFVKFDPSRRAAALELCKELARDRQILLFTCDDGYEREADQVIRLHP
jgi:uncharacterized protein YhaN